MLYDNGPLLQLCAWALQLRGDKRFRKVCTQTADWVIRDMQHTDEATSVPSTQIRKVRKADSTFGHRRRFAAC